MFSVIFLNLNFLKASMSLKIRVIGSGKTKGSLFSRTTLLLNENANVLLKCYGAIFLVTILRQTYLRAAVNDIWPPGERTGCITSAHGRQHS